MYRNGDFHHAMSEKKGQQAELLSCSAVSPLPSSSSDLTHWEHTCWEHNADLSSSTWDVTGRAAAIQRQYGNTNPHPQNLRHHQQHHRVTAKKITHSATLITHTH